MNNEVLLLLFNERAHQRLQVALESDTAQGTELKLVVDQEVHVNRFRCMVNILQPWNHFPETLVKGVSCAYEQGELTDKSRMDSLRWMGKVFLCGAKVYWRNPARM